MLPESPICVRSWFARFWSQCGRGDRRWGGPRPCPTRCCGSGTAHALARVVLTMLTSNQGRRIRQGSSPAEGMSMLKASDVASSPRSGHGRTQDRPAAGVPTASLTRLFTVSYGQTTSCPRRCPTTTVITPKVTNLLAGALPGQSPSQGDCLSAPDVARLTFTAGLATSNRATRPNTAAEPFRAASSCSRYRAQDGGGYARARARACVCGRELLRTLPHQISLGHAHMTRSRSGPVSVGRSESTVFSTTIEPGSWMNGLV